MTHTDLIPAGAATKPVRPGCAVITGPPASGKTLLLHHLVASLSGAGARCHVLGAVAHQDVRIEEPDGSIITTCGDPTPNLRGHVGRARDLLDGEPFPPWTVVAVDNAQLYDISELLETLAVLARKTAITLLVASDTPGTSVFGVQTLDRAQDAIMLQPHLYSLSQIGRFFAYYRVNDILRSSPEARHKMRQAPALVSSDPTLPPVFATSSDIADLLAFRR